MKNFVYLLLIILVGIFGCGCTMSEDYKSSLPDEWRPDESIILEVAWLTQQQEGPPDDFPSNNCGPTTLEMVIAYIAEETPTFPEVVKMISWMAENVSGYEGTGEQFQGSPTNRAQMEYTSLEYFGLTAEAFGEDTDDSISGLEGLWNELHSGLPVFITTYSQELEMGEEMTDEGINHDMLLVGMTLTQVIFHDPGLRTTSDGAYRVFSIESFDEAGWNYHGGIRFMP